MVEGHEYDCYLVLVPSKKKQKKTQKGILGSLMSLIASGRETSNLNVTLCFSAHRATPHVARQQTGIAARRPALTMTRPLRHSLCYLDKSPPPNKSHDFD